MKPLVCGLMVTLACVISRPAQAESILFTGTGLGANSVTLNASALFDITGTTLTITLRNTGDNSGQAAGSDARENALTGLFFDLPNSIGMPTNQTATIAAGSLINGNLCDVGPCNAGTTTVGGEFRYSVPGGTLPHGADRGIASSGYSAGSGYTSFGTTATFAGSNLDGLVSVDNSPNFAIIAPISLANPFLPNANLAEPVVDGAVQFTLTMPVGTILHASDLKNVSFQYGRNYSDPNISGSASGSVPEPATAFLAISGIAIAMKRRARSRARRS